MAKMKTDIGTIFSSLQDAVEVALEKQAAKEQAQAALSAATTASNDANTALEAIRSQLNVLLANALPTNSNPRVTVG
jgi:ABC-type transporter Mla subunit MlaD